MRNRLCGVFSPLIFLGTGFIFLFVISGCTPLKPQTDPTLDKKANLLAKDTRSLNQDILSSKGTGWVEITTHQMTTHPRKDKFKLAWAAQAPNRLRITLLMSGHPVETIVATGEHVTFISHTGEHPPHTTLSSDPDLERFIQVPMKLSGLIALLLGRIPLEDFDNAWFEPNKNTLPPVILTQNFKSTRQQLYVDEQNQVQRLVSLSRDNTPLYDITYLDYQTHGQSRIPATLLIQNVAGRQILLSLTRFIPNPPIKESVFRLTEPGS
jgi:hypothetical protein